MHFCHYQSRTSAKTAENNDFIKTAIGRITNWRHSYHVQSPGKTNTTINVARNSEMGEE